jgi:hypothetical protein
VGDRPRAIPISIWDEGIVGQHLQRRKKEVNASSAQLSDIAGVELSGWGSGWPIQLEADLVRAILSPHLRLYNPFPSLVRRYG